MIPAHRLVADAAAIRVPTLLLSAGADWVVDNGAQRQFFERLSSTDKTLARAARFSSRDLSREGSSPGGRTSPRICDAPLRHAARGAAAACATRIEPASRRRSITKCSTHRIARRRMLRGCVQRRSGAQRGNRARIEARFRFRARRSITSIKTSRGPRHSAG